MERRKQIPFRLSSDLNNELTKIAEYEETTKNSLLIKEFKQMVKKYKSDKEYMVWYEKNKEVQ